ncbi:hypothetical protein K2173_019377 [Erythroxylum novogranatense]|uniref:Leucine-rich repeat-containing N-terminal plant-type domain-containing protein n=1 Tax=Erythroxylum novogranatense TaxID=1862640 RepID=A0AAV8S4Z9_9ROSI|nr:hypothetical protein K2173_019377 [Erythroxylum novogranatense]
MLSLVHCSSWNSSIIHQSCTHICKNTQFIKGSDQQALLDFKDGIIDDPNKILSSWNESVHVCSWIGVSCSPSNGRVVSLNLEAQGLVGSLTPSIGNITYLSVINLRDNAFGGEIPEQIGRLRNLKSLNLSRNSFIGKIPYNLSKCRELTEVDARTIPPWIGNFSSLQFLKLAENNLQGSIPSELGKLSRLVFLHLYGNQLSGMIPLSLYNLSSMYHFSIAQNQLHGWLPPDIGITLPKLTIFAAGVNNFTGAVPESLANASGLLAVDFAQNGLTGPVPRNLARLVNIKRLNFDDNHLGNGELGDLDFLSSLVNCTWLQVLGLAGNHFAGELPSFIANFSIWAREITMGENLIHGSIPSGMDKLERLYLLGLENNYTVANFYPLLRQAMLKHMECSSCVPAQSHFSDIDSN